MPCRTTTIAAYLEYNLAMAMQPTTQAPDDQTGYQSAANWAGVYGICGSGAALLAAAAGLHWGPGGDFRWWQAAWPYVNVAVAFTGCALLPCHLASRAHRHLWPCVFAAVNMLLAALPALIVAGFMAGVAAAAIVAAAALQIAFTTVFTLMACVAATGSQAWRSLLLGLLLGWTILSPAAVYVQAMLVGRVLSWAWAAPLWAAWRAAAAPVPEVQWVMVLIAAVVSALLVGGHHWILWRKPTA
ncbi:MAG: hypothetical protein HKL96_00345 [Phycisphaerales bacterium]|nr:hypothetical protein [Phycisphaerales bacterium]